MAKKKKVETQATPTTKGGTKIIKCTCINEYMDEHYGEKMRVHNFGPKKNGNNPGYSCVVCGEIR